MKILQVLRNKAKESQWIYFTYSVLFKKDLREGIIRCNSHVKSCKQIIRELILLKNYWGCFPLHYFRYRLYEKNITDEELKNYIPPYFLYVRHNPAIFSNVDKNYFGNKLNLYYEFTKRGVKTVPVLAYYSARQGVFRQPSDDSVIDETVLADSIGEHEKLFLKPVDGQGGTGIVVIKRLNGKCYCNGEELNDIKSVLKECDYVVQKGLVQRDDVMSINSSSVNTLRIVTKWDDERPSVRICVMRIGRNGKDVDNSHQGGLSVQINIKDGAFFPTATAEHGGGVLTEHPDSHFRFKGKTMNKWSEIKQTMEKYAQLFPELKEIAWDVAVTEEGATIIEMNLGFGIDHLQCCVGGGEQSTFHIPDKVA